MPRRTQVAEHSDAIISRRLIFGGDGDDPRGQARS